MQAGDNASLREGLGIIVSQIDRISKLIYSLLHLARSEKSGTVRPVQIDARWSVQERGGTTEVTARLMIDPGGMLGPLGRFVPRALIEQRLAKELDASMDALEQLLAR